jgi:hypothetical protein
MSDKRKARLVDDAFRLMLVLLVGLWALYPPQRIDPRTSGENASVRAQAQARDWTTP